MPQNVHGDPGRFGSAPFVLLLTPDEGWAEAIAAQLVPVVSTRPPACHSRLPKALAHLANQEADLVFVDLDMPGGLEALERIRAASALSALVAIAGEANETLALEALRRGAQDYLVKDEATRTLRGTTRFTLERTRVLLEAHRGEHLLARTLEALPFPVALLDEMGCIAMCNAGWGSYANTANPLVQGCGLGDNYLALCDRLAESESGVHRVAHGILQVMACLEARFTFAYPLEGPESPLRGELTITRMPMLLGPSVLICYHEMAMEPGPTA